MIPRFAPTYSYADLLRALSESRLGHGAEDLRQRLAGLFGLKYVFLFEAARVALYALLKAYNRPGGVLMPAYNCIVVPEAVHFAGYRPEFVDIDNDSLNMTVETLSRSMSSRISVVLATHLFGIPCDVEAVKRAVQRYDALVVEDAAPALGAQFRGRLAGTFGDAAVISFHSSKVISAETGGALLTDNEELARRVESLAEASSSPHGNIRTLATGMARKTATRPWIYSAAHRGYRIIRDERMYEVVPGRTERPSAFLKPCPDLSIRLVLRQLDRLNGILGQRRRLAQIYCQELSGLPGLSLPVTPEGSSPAWIQFPIQVGDKRAFYRHMQRHGVDLTWTYRYSCAESYGLDGFPNAQMAAKRVLGLPTHPSLSEVQARYICRVAKTYRASMS